MSNNDQVVDIVFQLRGTTVPADHGYALYSAISRVLPEIHGDGSVGIHPIRGQLAGQRLLSVTSDSRLVVRVSEGSTGRMLALAGSALEIDGHRLDIGIPTLRPLRPASALTSRLVVIKGFTEPSPFVEAVRRQLQDLDIHGEPSLLARQQDQAVERHSAAGAGTPIRRTVRIRDKIVVGFAVLVEQLTAEESIKLQEHGLGGRRRFGCGVFVPARR